jgi:predicted RNA-binding protein YlqC (UPF0109 family)
VSEIDQQFIEYVVKSLVGKPDAVSVERRIDEKGVLLELTVDPEDLGRVIGKRGATAQSLRTLLRALGTKNDARYNLKIIDNGEHHDGPRQQSNQPTSDDSGTTNDVSSDDKPAEEPKESAEPTESQPEPEEEAKPEEENKEDKPNEEDAASDRLKQAREELADLDDLDV